MVFENGFPHNGSDWNSRISAGSRVCHSEPVGFWTFLANGALKRVSNSPKN